jgi:hypothetical protein
LFGRIVICPSNKFTVAADVHEGFPARLFGRGDLLQARSGEYPWKSCLQIASDLSPDFEVDMELD